MKFDAVVGNPPYQDKTVGDSKHMPPIYHLFMDSSHTLSDVVCLISPARFLFNAGATDIAPDCALDCNTVNSATSPSIAVFNTVAACASL